MNIYDDIRMRTNSQIYLGIVGPVRSGKSTFIKKFMDTIVIPNIEDEAKRERAIDELPQSASGRTIMTTEPKFIPEQAVSISLEDSASVDVRLIDDCVIIGLKEICNLSVFKLQISCFLYFCYLNCFYESWI